MNIEDLWIHFNTQLLNDFLRDSFQNIKWEKHINPHVYILILMSEAKNTVPFHQYKFCQVFKTNTSMVGNIEIEPHIFKY